MLNYFQPHQRQEVRRYDSKERIGRVESGTETENNAAIIKELLPEVITGQPI